MFLLVVLFSTLFNIQNLSKVNDTNYIVVSEDKLCFNIRLYVSKELANARIPDWTFEDLIDEIMYETQKIFAWHRLEVRAPEAEFWYTNNKIILVDDLEQDLINFQRFVEANDLAGDAHVLFVDFESVSTSLGRARYNSACTQHAVALVQGGKRVAYDPKRIARILAHELGHVLGAGHAVDGVDGCLCAFDQNKCIMNEKTFFWDEEFPPSFHSCSVREMLDSSLECLRTCPDEYNRYERCGNGIVDVQYEDCDCAFDEACQVRGVKDCCDMNYCMYKSKDVQCSEEKCCKDCKISSGNVCRAPFNDCDLAEKCSGSSASCPDDLYKQNGLSCGNKGFCYEGMCSTKDAACMAIFPDSDARYSEKCIEIAKSFEINDCAGLSSESLVDIFCGEGKGVCGQLYCEASYVNGAFFRFSVGGVTCYTLRGSDGLVPDGFSCDDNKICVDKKCDDMSNHVIECANCKPDQVCSNEGTCVSK